MVGHIGNSAKSKVAQAVDPSRGCLRKACERGESEGGLNRFEWLYH